MVYAEEMVMRGRIEMDRSYFGEGEAYDGLGMVQFYTTGQALLGNEAQGGDGELIKLGTTCVALAVNPERGRGGGQEQSFTSLGIRCIFAKIGCQ